MKNPEKEKKDKNHSSNPKKEEKQPKKKRTATGMRTSRLTKKATKLIPKM